MIADLDTLLIALYVELTDRIIPQRGFTRRGPGGRPEVTDAELVCLVVAQVPGPVIGLRCGSSWMIEVGVRRRITDWWPSQSWSSFRLAPI